MATTKETVDFILDQVHRAGTLRARKMFGEYALYCDEKVVALVCDEQLFVKITLISDSYLGSEHQAPPYPNAKNWLKVPEERLEEREWLTDFIRQTATALPKPKPKKKKS
jgi:DNA transformation protein and related proteins